MTLTKALEDFIVADSMGGCATAVTVTPKIHVDEIAAKIALFYEKVRSIIDYQDEHLLRKQTIIRTLKRRMIMSLDGKIAEAFIKDIIRSGHLANDTVSESVIPEVQRIVDGIRLLRKAGLDEEWLVVMAGNAIEEKLFPPVEEAALFDLAFQTIKPNLVLGGSHLMPEEVTLALSIALQRALFRVDEDRLTYRLLKLLYPNWDALPEGDAARVAHEVPAMRAHIKRLTEARETQALLQCCERYNTAFFLINDIVRGTSDGATRKAIFGQETELGAAVERAYSERFVKEKSRLNRLAWLSVISFLISKIAIAIAIEIPLEYYVIKSDFSVGNTFLNIMFPPLLMWVVIGAVRMPGGNNLELAIAEVRRIVDAEKERSYRVAIPKRRGVISSIFIYASYLATFGISFWLLIRLLQGLSFNVANIIVFLLFTSLVAAAGVKIQNRAKELSFEPERASVGGFVLDLFAMPLVAVGQWIIAGLAQFNVLVLLINLIIELPFQFLIEFLENFREFIQHKKGEIR